jgi:hypothetical protein
MSLAGTPRITPRRLMDAPVYGRYVTRLAGLIGVRDRRELIKHRDRRGRRELDSLCGLRV